MIELGGVRLRPPEERDVRAIQSLRNDELTRASLGGFSVGYSTRDVNEWLERHRSRADEVVWVVATVGDDECIGHTGLYNLDQRVRKAEFGIVLGRPNTGRGIGREVTTAVLSFGFRELNLRRIYLSVLANNERAIRLYRAIGFADEGRLREDQYRGGEYRDVLIMGLLRRDWEETGPVTPESHGTPESSRSP